MLVLGGGSGVGSAAIQIAKLIGARVITTAGSDEKLAKARELGVPVLDEAGLLRLLDTVPSFPS